MSIVANGWMDQGGTWHGGGPRSSRHCVRWGASSARKKGTAPPNFQPMSIMIEDATWYQSRPQPRPHCIRRGVDSAPPPAKGAQHPPLLGPCLLWQRSPISATATLLLNFGA